MVGAPISVAAASRAALSGLPAVVSTSASYSAEKGSMGPPPFALIHAVILGKYLFCLRMYSSRPMFTKYTTGFELMNKYLLRTSISLPFHMPSLIGFLSWSMAWQRRRISRSSISGLLFLREMTRVSSSTALAICCRSFWKSSFVMISKSRMGSTSPSLWMTSSLGKALTTWKIPSTAWMCDRKALPRPSPSWAPATRPAMSKMEIDAATLERGW
mmetsp:Transcript_14392/g.18195  ORF Transcript_14392/g.18195 Transcript_14392/m.18195 type:complete len:215 (-) Transcript_14392:255-899(-)